MSEQKVSEQREAGRELDAEVAERVLGRRTVKDRNGESLEFYGDHVELKGFFAQPKPYSSEIAQAFKVVEAMQRRHFSFRCDDNLTALPWYVGFRNDNPSPIEGKDFEAEAATLPLAICLAALAATESATPATRS